MGCNCMSSMHAYSALKENPIHAVKQYIRVQTEEIKNGRAKQEILMGSEAEVFQSEN